MAVLEADKEAAAQMLGIEVSKVQVVTARIKKACVAKGEQSWAEIVTELLPNDEYRIILQLGLEARLNSIGFSKVERATDKEGIEAAMEVAAANVEKLYKGELRAPVGLASMKRKVATASDKTIAAEARKLAKEEIKERIKAAGEKISWYAAKDITAKANEMLDDDEWGPPLWAKAEKVVAARMAAKNEGAKERKGDAQSAFAALGIKVDPESKAKAEAKKAAKKGAGRPVGRPKKSESAELRA